MSPDSKNRCPTAGLSNFLSQNKCGMGINTAGHLGFRLVLYGCRASAKHRTGCPAAVQD